MSSTIKKQNKFYVTTPIYYVNSNPHIGHTYTTVAADVLARYHRLIGEQVFFLTGTDEHGAKIEEKAREAGMDPKKFTDEIAAKFQMEWDRLNISYDKFIRTTDQEHIEFVKKSLQAMYNDGDIYEGKYEGLYCQGCEQFKSEKDLVDGLCPDHKIAPQAMSEKCYMFKLSKYTDEILKKIKSDEIEIRPLERKNEILSFYEKEGLNDISFSRANVKWGISLPWDKNQTAYVWADAFLNYLSALIPASDPSSPPSPSPSPERGANASSPLLYKEGSGVVWPPDVQLMSKDILRVHATIWPAMLLSLGLPLPKKIFTHGFFLFEGMKMSKSLGNVISSEMMIEKYGVDATRYLLLSATTFGHDGDISWIFFNEKYNADLANGIGNLVSRSVTLAAKMENVKIKNQNDNSKFKIKDSWKEYQEYFNDLNLDKIIEVIRHTASLLDNYITTNKPWELIKKKDASTGEVMYNILESLRHIALMVYPFMPETAEKIFTDLGLDPAKEFKKDFKELIEWGGLSADVKIKKEEGLFPRISS